MAYIASNYKANSNAPIGQWCCDKASNLGPYEEPPEKPTQDAPGYCGECVSFVKRVCETLPATKDWKRGDLAKGNKDIKDGTVIATFSSDGAYNFGHAAIYVSQNASGISVYDQYNGSAPKAAGPRRLKFGGTGESNDGDKFFVVE